jgi:lysophospholipase L1-like esterase
MSPKEPIVVFIGDSLTEGGNWAALLEHDGVINHGVAGDTTADILARLDDAIVPEADQYFILAGINDLNAGVEPQQLLQNLLTIVQRLTAGSSNAAFYLQSMLPVNTKMFSFTYDTSVIRAINEHLRGMENPSQRIFFLDLFPGMADAEGELKPELTLDGIHLTDAGYAIWSDVIRPYVKQGEE